MKDFIVLSVRKYSTDVIVLLIKMLTKTILIKLAEQELQSRIKSIWTNHKISTERYRLKHYFLGLCSFCSNKLARTSKCFCDQHLKKMRNYESQRRLKRRENNQCKYCGCSLKEMDTSIQSCNSCLDRYNLLVAYRK